MNAIVYDLQRVRRRTTAPAFDLPASLLTVAETFGLELPGTFSEFILRRTRGGTEVHIRGGRLTLNLSAYAGVYPANFKDARRWIAAVADRQGWEMIESRRYTVLL